MKRIEGTTPALSVHCRDCGLLSGGPFKNKEETTKASLLHCKMTGHLAVFSRPTDKKDGEIYLLRQEKRDLARSKEDAEYQYRLLKLDGRVIKSQEKDFRFNALIFLLAISLIVFSFLAHEVSQVGRIMAMSITFLFGYGTIDDYIQLKRLKVDEKKREKLFLSELRK